MVSPIGRTSRYMEHPYRATGWNLQKNSSVIRYESRNYTTDAVDLQTSHHPGQTSSPSSAFLLFHLPVSQICQSQLQTSRYPDPKACVFLFTRIIWR